MTGKRIKRNCGEFFSNFTRNVMVKNVPLFAVAFYLLFNVSPCHGIQNPFDSFSADAAFSYLEKQVEFGPRNPGSQGHSKCQAYITEILRSFTSHVTLQPFLHKDSELNRTFSMANIIARFPGKNPSIQGILLAAHWDTRPRADRESDPELKNQPIPGANDGASGVAVLLEIAKVLSQYPPPVPVDLVFFDGEDYGKSGDRQNYLLGSKYYAKTLRGSTYQFGLLLDMVGDKNLRIRKERYSNKMLPHIVDSVWKRAETLNLSAFENRIGAEIYDDHQPLIQVGVPIIVLIHDSLVGSEYWHTLEDTPDKCSPASLKQVGSLVLSLIYNGL